MKQRLIKLILIFSVFISCKYVSKKKDIVIENNKKLEYMEVLKENHIIYSIHAFIAYPFEIFIDKIPIARELEKWEGTSMSAILNEALLINGKHQVTLRIYPNDINEGFNKQSWETQNFVLNKWVKGANDKVVGDIEDIAIFPLTYPSKKTPYYEQQWEIEIKDLPYELEGWRNGQDLSKWDKEVLQKKVVAYYEKLRTILDDGDTESWAKLTEIRKKETNTLNYTSKEKIQRKFKENSRRVQG